MSGAVRWSVDKRGVATIALEPGEPARDVAELSERAGFGPTRATVWRYEPGAKGRQRHVT